MPSICQGNWDCQNCPKAVSNAIAHIIYQRGFHMSDGVEKSSKRGMFARNVAKLTLDNVKIEGQVGEAYELEGVDELIRR